MRTGWRFLAAPLAVWLMLTCIGAGVLFWVEHTTKQSVVARYQDRVGLTGKLVESTVKELIERERTQALAFLTEPVVSERDFTRSVGGFGYPAAVLLDSEGRLLQVIPSNPAVIGERIADRYPHLRTAVDEGRPAVSPVVASAARGLPVVAFAVPFDTSSGLRVFSGAVPVGKGPIATYLRSAITLERVKVNLVDDSDAIVAANTDGSEQVTRLANAEPDLSAALRRAAQGRYLAKGQWWRYTSLEIPNTPWRLSAAVPEDVLFANTAGSRAAGRAALVTASGVGLLVVAATARARRNRRELHSTEQRFRRLFDNSRIGMAMADLDGRFLRVNPALCNMLGRPERALVGVNFAEITHPDDLEACLKCVRDCMSGRVDGFDMEKRYLHADGHPIEVIITAGLLRDEEGRSQYFATQIIDVTERRMLERARREDAAELARHAERLEHANEQMADFMAMLSHDVRQPLTTIVSAGEMLLDDWTDMPDETRRHYLRRMTTGGHRAEQLVSEILTLAQLDAGALTARPVRLDVAHAARQAVSAQGYDAAQGVTVTAPDQAIAVADPVHLALLLGNLLANAVKYGAPPINVTVRPDGDRVTVRVSDHGEGVPAAFVPHLFERFTRAETGVATTKPGTGLGLYLVARLARASGATITYQPNRPRGAMFVLSLPCTPAQATPVVAEPGTPVSVS
ncbi:PAS domain S-box protein [Actinoplanes sp. NPDC023801]|uniref:PAS domain S-box protein n=1 Tax=Actinoplanes sp. NPDC023801 TaxID=3154595 RepID=UPI0033D9EED4